MWQQPHEQTIPDTDMERTRDGNLVDTGRTQDGQGTDTGQTRDGQGTDKGQTRDRQGTDKGRKDGLSPGGACFAVPKKGYL